MILVTGATGLLGSHLVNYLLYHNYQVKVLIRNKEDENNFSKNSNLSCSIGDVLDVSSLEDAFIGVSTVYHCAGLISFSPFDKDQLYNVNVVGTANVVNICIHHKIEKLCHVSSVAAIGKSKNSNISSEDDKWDNSTENSYYGYTKYLGELEVWRGIEEGLNAVIINPSVILGYSKWSSPSMFLFKYVKDENTFYTGGGNNFVGVNDVVNVMVKLMESNTNSERFIIAGERVTYKQLFESIAKNLKVSPPKRLANRWMLRLVSKLEYLKAMVFNSKPLITKETINVSTRVHEYSSQKIKNLLKLNFAPIEEIVENVCSNINTK